MTPNSSVSSNTLILSDLTFQLERRNKLGILLFIVFFFGIKLAKQAERIFNLHGRRHISRSTLG